MTLIVLIIGLIAGWIARGYYNESWLTFFD